MTDKFTTININNTIWPNITTYYFCHPVFIYSVVGIWSNVPASNFPKNQKLDPNSGNFLLVGLSPDVFLRRSYFNFPCFPFLPTLLFLFYVLDSFLLSSALVCFPFLPNLKGSWSSGPNPDDRINWKPDDQKKWPNNRKSKKL